MCRAPLNRNWRFHIQAPRIAQVLGNEIAQAQSFIQLAHQNETAIGGDPKSLEIYTTIRIRFKPRALMRRYIPKPSLLVCVQ